MPMYVNLDAMVPREDFAVEAPETLTAELFDKFGIDRLLASSGSTITTHLRKPDFQRETNHWTPSQICTLLQSFTDNDLIPALILWNSKTHMFVIDGCHRISVLRAWIEDDYGDGALSVAHFGVELPKEQVKAAKKTRELIKSAIGSFKDLQGVNSQPAKFSPALALRAKTATTRSLVELFATAERNNNKNFFFKFTEVRQQLERFLIDNKTLMTQLNIATGSKRRRAMWVKVLAAMIDHVKSGQPITTEFVVDAAGFTGGEMLAKKNFGASITDDVKSAVFIKMALANPMLCPVCGGVLPQKSVSYDHKQPKSQGGLGNQENVQLTHPFCNSGYKNRHDQLAVAQGNE